MIEIQGFQFGTRHFQALIQNLADLVTVHDARGTIRFATPSTAKLLGYQEDQLIGRNAFELIHPEDMRIAESAFQQVVQGRNQGHPTEYRVRCADGHWLNIETVGTNFIDDARIHGIVLTSRDVSDRKRHEQHRLALITVAGALREAETRSALQPIILKQVLEHLSLDGAALLMCDGNCREVIVEVARGTAEGTTGLHITPPDGLFGRVLETGEAFHSNCLQVDPFNARPALLTDVVAAACLPLKTRKHAIGLLWVERSASRDMLAPIGEEELQLLTAIADMAANAIDRATLHEQTQLRLHRLTALQTIDLAISGSLDLMVTLKLLLGEVTSRLRVDAADVLVMQPHTGSLLCAASRGFDTAFMARPEFKFGQELAKRALLERKTMYLPDLKSVRLPPESQKIVDAEGFITYYGVPLIATGRIVGVLELFQRTSLPRDTEWVNYLDGLAAHVAFAIEKVSLIQDLQQSNASLIQAYDGVIEGWSRALALRDHETHGHTERVTEMTMRMARLLSVASDQLIHIRRGAMLHDIGKIALPDSILLKAEPLSAEDWEALRKHPMHAYELIYPIDYLKAALDIPYCHHERWDGTGYPRHLKGQEIPLAARIFSIVDVYDALTSDRPYRSAWSHARAVEYILSESGKAFEAGLVQAFVDNLPQLLVEA